ncbi:hypothetical protein PHMEG_00015340 [Phytophthora megakarya]|uniref:Uncharacterized protein n=1 Tax=Phytophthora megakarya TaxID=4795 RepID=A0A225W1I4_9STRA|nr:hypothetical protein PHMEG_00015340 [Phytophthora megakarya]
MCSNDLYDAGNIAVRLCSTMCVDKWKAKYKPALTDGTAKTTCEIVGWSQNLCFNIKPAKTPPSEEVSNSQSSADDTMDSNVRVDAFGIPLEVHHYRPLGKRDSVWDVVHVLSAPRAIGMDDDAEMYSHVCVLCALRLTSQPNAHDGT